ncbi:MAG TPA: hypothetical protein VHG52_05110 [Thermomicrobiales bacterium]|nr:hypothetical protein [Thermomicrobiales bacterium]
MSATADTFAFEITRAGWVKWLLWLVGATSSRSYVTLDNGTLRARFGYYTLEVPTQRITHAERSTWPWHSGIGIRTNMKDTIGLVGSYDNIVRLDIDPPVRASVLKIPVNVSRLYLSLDNPDRFLSAINTIRQPMT